MGIFLQQNCNFKSCRNCPYSQAQMLWSFYFVNVDSLNLVLSAVYNIDICNLTFHKLPTELTEVDSYSVCDRTKINVSLFKCEKCGTDIKKC